MTRETGFPAPAMGEPYLLTPGPLTTAAEVKQAMFPTGAAGMVIFAPDRRLRDQLLHILGSGYENYECIPIQGSGTYAVEACGSFVPRDGKVLVLANGAYGLRAAETLDYLGRHYHLLDRVIICRRAVMRWQPFWQLIRPSPMCW